MIAYLDSITQATAPTPPREWWVVGYCSAGEIEVLAVCCKLTKACAAVYDPSPREIAAAESLPGEWKYPWTDESRLTLLDLKKLQG